MMLPGLSLAALIAITAAMLLAMRAPNRGYWYDHQAVVMQPRRDLVITVAALMLSFGSAHLIERKASAFRGVVAGEHAPDVEQINPIDRLVAGRWSTTAKDAGRIFKTTAVYLVPIALLLVAGSVRRRVVLLWVFSQGYVLTESITGITKGIVDRLRPFTYIDSVAVSALAPKSRGELLEDLASSDVHNAFFSGDASITAFGLLFFALVYRRCYVADRWRTVVLSAAIIGIVLGMLFRSLSGKHFPSDVIVGGLVGGLVAWGVIRLHVFTGNETHEHVEHVERHVRLESVHDIHADVVNEAHA